MAHAKQRGVKTVYLEVKENNAEAQSLYETLGFAVLSRRKDYYRTETGHQDAIVMRKTL